MADPYSAGGAPYCGIAPVPATLLERWNLDPVLLVALAAMAGAFFLFAGPRRDQSAAFTAAMLVLLIAFVSPLCPLTSALFSARAAHHLILVAVAGPLLALALPRMGRRLGMTGALILSTAVYWVWHVPAVYEAALASTALYWVLQLAMIGSAAAFWAEAMAPESRLADLVVGLLVAMTQMGLLGALLTFAPAPLYTPHYGVTGPWGLTALEDQQLAGLLMWVVSIPIYIGAILAIAGRRLWAVLPRETA
jgi:putative membrane protein